MGKQQTYSEKLRSPEWQKKRLLVMERDGWKCKRCTDGTTMLAVHHKYYLPNTEPWEYPDECYETVCDPCHKKEHKIESPAPPAPYDCSPETVLKLILANPDHSDTELLRIEMLKIEIETRKVDVKDDAAHKALSEKWHALYEQKAKLHEEKRRKIRLGIYE